MHAKNMPPDAVNSAVEWYYSELQHGQDTLAQLDADAEALAQDKLRADWGQDYTPNMNHLKQWLAGGPEGLSDQIMSARAADGTLLKNNPDFMNWISQTAREVNPMNMVLPAGNGDRVSNIATRMGEIETMMRTNRAAYDKNPAIQEEYRNLIEARDKHQAA